MRSAADLPELPYAFTQLRPLLPNQFIRVARDRGFSVTEDGLEALHRLKLLTPLLRVRRDSRAIARAVRAGDVRGAHQLASWHPTSPLDLQEARRQGRLFAAADEGFIARRRLLRTLGERRYRSSDYLYSQHQLVQLEAAAKALPFLRRGRGGVAIQLDADRWWRDRTAERGRWVNDVVVAVSALEPVYYPSIAGKLQLVGWAGVREYERWRFQLPVTWALKWLGVDADWVRDTAARLLRFADQIDPLGAWLDIVREASPSSWEKLRGTARLAVDTRIAAEVLLRYYEDLVDARRARRLPQPARSASGFDTRLVPRRRLDDVLTRFGLSPHPRLLLVVEGDTELAVFPRVFDHFGVRRDSDFISLENAEGVDRDLHALVAYAAAPRTELERDGDTLRLTRPPTRILVVTDAEGTMTRREQRERKRAAWVERLLRTLPPEHRTDRVRETLELLVHVETWNGRGESFEFAHFTDRQLAIAIDSLDTRRRQPAMEDRIQQIGRLRPSGNLESTMPRSVSKVELADALWPALEAKLRRAERRKTVERIPIVRVIDRAIFLANEFPRGGLVIPLGTRSPG